ncbi:MAG: hypothetical protein AB8G17_13140 [Gammaproteobacteria bacterium]
MYLREHYDISERRACQAMQINRSSYRYVGQRTLIDAGYKEVLRLSDAYR